MQLRLRANIQLYAEGGRRGPIYDGYRGAINLGDGCHDALIELLEPKLFPGESADVYLVPVDPTLWTTVTAGQAFVLQEGTTSIGRGELLDGASV